MGLSIEGSLANEMLKGVGGGLEWELVGAGGRAVPGWASRPARGPGRDSQAPIPAPHRRPALARELG